MPLMQLAVWDGVVDDGAIAGTAADMSAWREAGHPVRIVPVGPDANVEKLPPWAPWARWLAATSGISPSSRLGATAVLALHNAAEFSCDYVGNTEMAKRYGRLRMFLLRRARDGTGPAVLGDIERAAG
jgi:hypothetical protein